MVCKVFRYLRIFLVFMIYLLIIKIMVFYIIVIVLDMFLFDVWRRKMIIDIGFICFFFFM